MADSYATETEVQQILDSSPDLEDLTPFLNAAHTIVAAKCTGIDYSENELSQIEAWLAAHLHCAKDPQISKEKTGNAETTYDGKTGTGLESTRYGQNVKLLDYKGALADLDKQKGRIDIGVLF